MSPGPLGIASEGKGKRDGDKAGTHPLPPIIVESVPNYLSGGFNLVYSACDLWLTLTESSQLLAAAARTVWRCPEGREELGLVSCGAGHIPYLHLRLRMDQ